ncbi:ABC transporter substrate binding protein [Balneatrix alpica]|uniref:ABC transporter substrate binding protein n=1 Tax=Balneatrix alpica TaxID=75684 RepID=A0ABV5ZFW5_9GAMM|nr:ABC transporter substrate binding protein [Balneatrix alpica]
MSIRLILCWGVLLFASVSQAAPSRVLLLHSYHNGFAWTDQITDSVRSTLKQSATAPELQVEYLDTLHTPLARSEQAWVQLLQSKLSDHPIDALLAADNDALEFAIRQRPTLFAQVPIVFTGINGFTPTLLGQETRITGVTEQLDIRGTLSFMRMLHPDRSRLLVISDNSERGRTQQELLQAAKPAEFGFRLEILSEWYLAELSERLSQVDDNTLIVLLTPTQDKEGREQGMGLVFKHILQYARVPSYTFWELGVRGGATGGSVLSARQQGQDAARMVLRILAGESIQSIPIQLQPNSHPMLNAEALERFKLRLPTLPDKLAQRLEIINQQPSFWRENAQWVVMVMLLFIVQSLIILGLYLNWRKRRQAEQRLSQQTQELRQERALLTSLMDGLPDPITFKDAQGRYLTANAAMARLLQRDKGVLVNLSDRYCLPANVADQLEEMDQQALQSLHPQSRELQIPGHAEQIHTMEATSLPVAQSRSGGSVITILRDISQQKRSESSRRTLTRAVEQSASGVLIMDRQGLIEYVNQRFCALSQYSARDLIGYHARMLQNPRVNDHFYLQLWRTVRGGGVWRGELQGVSKHGDQFWCLASLSPVQDSLRNVTHVVAVIEDVSHIKQAQESMEQLAFYDVLTGLANRVLFREQLQSALTQGEPFALFYIDLDNFKRVNDTLGHDAGDQLLVTVSHRLQGCLREQDQLARIGGDEFTLLMPGVSDLEQPKRLAERMLDALYPPIMLGGQEVQISCSIGITLYPMDGQQATELMKNADLAMYKAKERGRNTFDYYSRELNIHAQRRLSLESELRHALQQQEFELYFQPQINLTACRVHCVEALIRWHHPQRGMISPGEFIQVAEESGLILPIGNWVLKEACRQLLRFHQHGYMIKVAINLSPAQFRDRELLNHIADALAESGLEARWLELEITESMLMDNMADAIAQLQHLQALGISLSIDDFGTGYSSLNYLKQLPVDALKVDRGFVRDIPQDADDMAITAGVIAMAHKLGLQVVAEGVETLEQLAFLKENACDLGQGYLFSPPLPIDAMIGMMPALPLVTQD